MYKSEVRRWLCLSVRKCTACTFKSIAVLLCAPIISGAAYAASLGMVADSGAGVFRLFDAQTDVVLASFHGSEGLISGDCVLSQDESTGFASHAGNRISVFELTDTTAGKQVKFSSIEISNTGVDMSLSPDGQLLVSAGAGHIYEPLSVVDVVNKTELFSASLFLDHTSAEFCDDGTLLVTTSYGDSFAMPHDNAIYDVRISVDGELRLSGNRLSSGAQPNNSSCAPGSRAGVLLDREAGLTSFTLPGMQKADYVKLHGAIAVAAVFNQAGDRLYVRTTQTVEAFYFNPFNGTLKADWVQPVAFSSEYFGIDQIALDLDSGKLYVDGGRELLVLDLESGRPTVAIGASDATGVCFASRQRHSPIRDIVAVQ